LGAEPACSVRQKCELELRDRLCRVLELIQDAKYFTLHATLQADRQPGKTTCARWLVDHLNGEGRFHAIWVDLQTVSSQHRRIRIERNRTSLLLGIRNGDGVC
jgi:hypothetical protein